MEIRALSSVTFYDIRRQIDISHSQAHYLPFGLCYMPMALAVGIEPPPSPKHGDALPLSYTRMGTQIVKERRRLIHLLCRWGVRVTIPAGLRRSVYSRSRLHSGLPPQETHLPRQLIGLLLLSPFLCSGSVRSKKAPHSRIAIGSGILPLLSLVCLCVIERFHNSHC